MTPTDSIDFMLFVAWWNRFQNQTTPRLHFVLSHWLFEHYERDDRLLLLMAFRGCGKSTLVALYAAWRLTVNPTLRILLMSADDPLAERLTRNIRRIIERHPACTDILPQHPDEWAANRFTVNRRSDMRDPSVVAAGITGNITGMRADLIICDDVEVPNTSDSADKRADLRDRLHELSFVATPEATTIYVGTPHTFDTIYCESQRTDIPDHAPFLNGAVSLRLPIFDANGQSQWPERFNLEKIESIKRTVGAYRFASQMMLTPTSVRDYYLNPAHLLVYDAPLYYAKEWNQTTLGAQDITAIQAWWDPALATQTGDNSVLAVVAFDTNGHIYIHHLAYLRVENVDNIAQTQCDLVANVLRTYRVPRLGVETNGIGNMLPGILRQTITRLRLGTVVIPSHTREAKNDRMIRALQTPLAARMVHLHRSVLETPFMDELRDFRPERSNNRDDGLDAVAGAILMEPLRLPADSSGPTSPRPDWRIKS